MCRGCACKGRERPAHTGPGIGGAVWYSTRMPPGALTSCVVLWRRAAARMGIGSQPGCVGGSDLPAKLDPLLHPEHMGCHERCV